MQTLGLTAVVARKKKHADFSGGCFLLPRNVMQAACYCIAKDKNMIAN